MSLVSGLMTEYLNLDTTSGNCWRLLPSQSTILLHIVLILAVSGVNEHPILLLPNGD